MLRSLNFRSVVVDVAVSTILCLLLLAIPRMDPGDALDVLTTVGYSSAFALRRLSPGIALTIAWLIAVLEMATQQAPGPENLLIAGIVYSTSAYGGRRVRAAGLISAIVGAITAAIYLTFYSTLPGVNPPKEMFPFNLLALLALLLLPWVVGVVRRTRNAARQSHEAQLLAERDTACAERAVAIEQERVRIAREMHDIVAHSLAVVVAQADGARYASRTDSQVAEQALDTISSTARRALGDVRELLGALRHEQGTVPAPNADDIDKLVDEMRKVGLDVEVDRQGDSSSLPTTTQLAVYRIVQESLTNAYKHGEHGTPVRARVTYRPDTVEIDVVNRRASDGRPGPGTRHGLVGMRERATMSGGTMTAGPRGDDFEVAVRMPTQPATGQMPRVMDSSAAPE